MSSRRKKTVRKAARARAGARKKTGRKAGARKTAARKKAARGRVRARLGPPPRPQPVETLTKKYDQYFQEIYNRVDEEAGRVTMRCCGSAPEIPEDDRGIGEGFANLTAALRAYRPDLGITDEEILTIRNWRPDQLRTLRAAFLEIYYPPNLCRRPKKARFRGFYTPGSKSIRYEHGDGIEVVIKGP